MNVSTPSEDHAENTGAKIESLSLGSICCDCGTQIRANIHEETIEEYADAMRNGVQFPPGIVFFDSTRYIMADGFHRRFGLERAGFKEMKVEVRIGTKSDALKYALGANAKHGLKRSNADKRRSVELALAEWPERSDRWIAETCAVSDRFVSNMRSENPGANRSHLTETMQEARPAVRIGMDGKQYPVRPSCSPPTEPQPQVTPAEAPEPTLLSLFQKPAETLTPEQQKSIWARVHPDLKSEVADYLGMVKADAELLLEKFNEGDIEPGALKDCESALRFAAKKVEGLIQEMIFLSQN